MNEEKIIEAYENYIQVLGDEISDLHGIAIIHGWESKNVERGVEARKKIAELKAASSKEVESGFNSELKGWVALFKDEKNYLDFLKWQREQTKEVSPLLPTEEVVTKEDDLDRGEYRYVCKNCGYEDQTNPNLKFCVYCGKERDYVASSNNTNPASVASHSCTIGNSIGQIMVLAFDMMHNNKDWRFGQSVFNAAHELFPSVANKLRGGTFDCFYDDKKISKFIDAAKSWLISTPNVQVSDTTGDHSSNAVDEQNHKKWLDETLGDLA